MNKTHQFQVRDFQMMAGQPVRTTPLKSGEPCEFLHGQVAIVREEVNELISHLSHGRPVDRIAIADDLADIAFTVLGLANVLGVTFHPQYAYDISESDEIMQAEDEALLMLQELDRILSRALGDAALIHSMIGGCIAIANEFKINLTAALDEVCECNKTKLWTAEELAENESRIKSESLLAKQVLVGDVVRYRVINTHGKLIKSPSTRKPDHSKSLS